MKIGIVTFAWSVNYGAALQALALQVILRRLGHRPFVLPINPGSHRSWLRRYVGPGVNATMRKIKYQRLVSKFRSFRRAFYDFNSLQEGDYAHFISNCPPADAYIAGSDQVWNLSVMQDALEEKFYFLQMCPPQSRRVAYAASWSMPEIAFEAEQRLRPILAGYKAISVRERSGVEILRKMGLSASWVPDPTLLLDQAEWTSLIGDNKGSLLSSQGAVLSYQLGWESVWDCHELAQQIARELQSSVIEPFPSGDAYLSPQEWLMLFAKARCVITNSFHGTVFAVLFHRPFVVIPIRGRFAGMNERVTSLLERVGLAGHLVTTAQEMKDAMREEINWDDVDERLCEFRHGGIAFLEQALA